MYNNGHFFEVIGKISVLFSVVDLFVTTLIQKLVNIEADPMRLPSELATLGAKFIYLEKMEVKNKTSIDILNSLSIYLPITM